MANIFREGWELGPNYSMFEQRTSSSSVGTARKRTGNYSFYAQSGDTNTILLPAQSSYYFAFGFNGGSAPTAGIRFGWRNVSTTLGGIGLSGGSFGEGCHFNAYVGASTIVATGSAPIFNGANDWYWIEIYVSIANSGGKITVKVDGITDINFTGDTKPSTQTTIDHIILTMPGSGNGCYFDDLIVDSTAWPGDHRIIYIPASSAGDVTQLTPVGAAQNWDCVNEVPPDGSSTYVHTTTIGQYDLYRGTIPALSNVTINGIQQVVQAMDLGLSGNINLGIKSGGTEYWEGNKALTNAWAIYRGTYRLVDPSDSAAWTLAKLTALQFGQKAG